MFDGLISFSSPFGRPLHFLGLELVILVASVAVLAHAILRYREGDRRHLFQWLVVSFYGLEMEIIAFNFLHNYEHATFTVQLYDGQLPLYVTGLYGIFLYTGIKVAERLHVHPVAEAFIAGFAMCLLDVPFDIAGVSLGWWTWLDDPVLAFRWLDVPVTSYYWYLIFGAVAVGLCRGGWRLLEKRPFALAVGIAPFLGFLIIVFGVIGFFPFHGLAALGVSYGTIVAAHLVGCAALAIGLRREPSRPDRVVTGLVLLVAGFHLAILVAGAVEGTLDEPWERLGAAGAAAIGLLALTFVPPLRRRGAEPSAARIAAKEVASLDERASTEAES